MPAALIIQLLATFGPPAVTLIDGLIVKWQTKSDVTPDEWSLLSSGLKLSAADHMKSQLTAAGIPLDSPQALSLIALVK